MKRMTQALTGTLALAALALTAPNIGALTLVRAKPTLSSTSTGFGLNGETITFSGGDYCGETIIGLPILGQPTHESVTCGHSVFIGLWAPDPSETGGFWTDSVTVLSSPGGSGLTSLAGVGSITGSLTIYCGNPNMQLYAYDIDAGTWVTGASVPSFACRHIKPIPGG